MTITDPDATATALYLLCVQYLRPPDLYQTDADTGLPVLSFVPALSAAEQATYADLLAMARNHVTGLSLAEYQALKAPIAEARTFRTRTPAEWQAMTAAQRDNALIQWSQDITDILRALLRDQ